MSKIHIVFGLQGTLLTSDLYLNGSGECAEECAIQHRAHALLCVLTPAVQNTNH